MNKKKYTNFNSGILYYEIQSNYIVVEFKWRSAKKYSYDVTGREMVDEMKNLAKNGKDLCSFINREKPKYEKKYCR